MAVNWRKDKNPNLILDNINKLKMIGDNGRISFGGFDFHKSITLLFNILIFDSEVSEIDARQIIYKAIFNVAKAYDITPENLRAELNKLENKFLSLPINRYVLVASFSLSQSITMKNVRLGNNIIFFERFLSKNFSSETRNSLIKDAARVLKVELPKNYSYVRVFNSSRSTTSAINQGLEDLNFIRGILNWVINSSYTIRLTRGGRPDPVNKLILGPIHTIHSPDGSLVGDDRYWYDPSYTYPIKPYTPNENELQILLRSQVSFRKKINNINWSEIIKKAFVRYAVALDSRDLTAAYLKLWGVLECLVNTNKHEVLVRRVSSIYQEREYHLQALNILREFRNLYVHTNEETDEIETYLYKLKNYVDNMFKLHLTNRLNFNSIDELIEFLDLPVDKDIILHRLKIYKLAKNFRNY